MCNLYRMTKATGEVTRWFAARSETSTNVGSEVYPGYPGLVIADGELVSMTWGFPLAMKSKKTGTSLKPKPVNNARTDKLDSFFWRYSFEERRSLIPLTAWAEAQGPRGQMTRTWMSMPDADLFACAGIWRDSEEWGRCYSMVMNDASDSAAEVHSRMPVLLAPEDYEVWTDGAPDEAKSLCQAWRGELNIDRTSQPWSARS
ncbi:MAG: SOS response-associated peptidase family protein [Erythrobacter sp.]|nr:SOS response-associated peptidase family protein [Erythrobacter sp.]